MKSTSNRIAVKRKHGMVEETYCKFIEQVHFSRLILFYPLFSAKQAEHCINLCTIVMSRGLHCMADPASYRLWLKSCVPGWAMFAIIAHLGYVHIHANRMNFKPHLNLHNICTGPACNSSHMSRAAVVRF